MLYEILCDKFISSGEPRGAIIFHDGLNVVQGHNSGSNSIGKSTFLLAVDFAFGGDDYANQKTIQKEIGDHIIKFCFVFDGIPHYFSRSTSKPKIVEICDKNYIPTGQQIKIAEFRSMLFNFYGITLSGILFRDIVGRYFRIYGKENSNEKRPLAVVWEETDEKSIKALLKLYDRFSSIEEAGTQFEKLKEHRKAIVKAQNFQIIKKINKTTYKQNLNRLEELQNEIDSLATRGRDELLDLDPNQAEKGGEYKVKLDALTKQKKRLWAQYFAVKNSSDFHRPATEQDFQELTKYFPNTNIKKLGEIESFHARLSTILAEEFSESMSSILALVNETSREITIIENAIKEINLPQRVSRATLESYAQKRHEIEEKRKENLDYMQKKQIDSAIKAAKAKYATLFMEQIAVLQAYINIRLSELNDYIYGEDMKAPVLTIPDINKYDFRTLNDDGTGTNYKNLIVLDIATLELTQLPALIHDTVLFKNIAVDPMVKIIDLYAKNQKQIFIAFDRTTTYPETAHSIINAKTVLRLSSGGNELFGRSWIKK